MTEPPPGTRPRLWERPALTWRLVTLVVSVFPQVLFNPVPRLLPRPARQDDAVLGTGIAHTDTAVIVAGYGPTPLPAAWFEYLTSSGLVPLALAVALMLPGVPGRRAAFAAMWALTAGGLLAAYVATSQGTGYVSVFCPFYLLAAVVLAAAGMRAALNLPRPTTE
ncbi:hypothetical protein [Actinomadura rugatobispora]|uniref:Uncharacterized protein n=1 Tax=Actinomadura rugatobispora TaxID=1994 RepID=A0ABW0ZYQ6_9ACTN|nr:hypothetical protein GCM10010200_076110 [Actinomadura rugatobispora]